MKGEVTVLKAAELEVIPEDFMRELEEESRSNLDGDDHPYLKLSIRNSDFKVGNDSVKDHRGMFTGVILGSERVNIYYKGQYTPGQPEAPDCFSVGGLLPSVIEPVAKKCVECKNLVFGSKITINGKKATACAETRRVVIANIEKGGSISPLLYKLSVPPTSLKNYSLYLKHLTMLKSPIWAVLTIMSFDSAVEYPKLTFTNSEVLPYEILLKLKELKSSNLVKAILSDYSSIIEEADLSDKASQDCVPTDSYDDTIPF